MQKAVVVVSELFWIRAPFSTQRHGLASCSFTIGVLLVPHYPPSNPAVKHKHSRELAGKMCVWPESHVMEETSFKQKYLLEIAWKLLVVVRRALCALCVRSQILILCVVFISILQFHIVCCNYSCRSGIQLSNYNPECGLGCCRQASAQHGPALVWIVYRLQITSSSFYFPAKCFRQFWHRCKCCTFTLKNLWRHYTKH